MTYKKYSLENLENWMHNAISCEEITPQEIFHTVKSLVEEQYHHHKFHTSRCYELLALLNGNGQSLIKEEGHNEPSMPPWGHSDLEYKIEKDKKLFGCDRDDPSEECKKSWNSFWEDDHFARDIATYQGSKVSSVQYTEEELNSMCDKAASDQEKQKCREYNLRESEYYNKRANLDMQQSNKKDWGSFYEQK